MFNPRNQIPAKVDPETYPLGENTDHPNGPALALLALSHTAIEHQLYLAMLGSAPVGNGDGVQPSPFTARHLCSLSGIRSLSTIRRALEGLISKLSIDRSPQGKGNGDTHRGTGMAYHVYPPAEILARRKQVGLASYINALDQPSTNHSFERALSRVVEKGNLSRREAQVALCCVEGLTNAEIGKRLQVTEQTVKFHLRHVFIKFGVKRRAELISRLLM